MNERLNASGYPFAKDDYRNQFETILSKMIACYNLMLSNNVRLTSNENSIRDYMLYNYLKKQWFKEQHSLTNYLFDAELPENKGRNDIRVIPVNPLINDNAYYVIECKRINGKNRVGKSGLNSEYITEGMYRFISRKYSSYFGVSGMIGFMVESMDINSNVTSINNLLATNFSEANTTQGLQYREIVTNFAFSYCSRHNVSKDSVVLYHLMFDFSKNIQ